MSRRRSRRNEEQRRRILIFLGKVLGAAGIVAVTAYYAYEVGYRVSEGEVQTSKEALQKAQDHLKAVEDAAEADHLAQVQANRQLSDLASRYEQIKPNDELRDLTDLLRAKLAAGLTARRLSLVIKSAEMPRNCQPSPSRRLLVHTPSAKTMPAGGLLRLDDQVSVTAEAPFVGDGRGMSFDPAGAVKLRISVEGVRDAEVVGVLPLDYLLSAKGGEYHITLSAANSKGWVDVATERCAFR
ncbi:hypothetical protein [Telmatospirillum sp.]|uniref:hypothetical protein n=1 Tax=Telmatospirillum sp. TaxID=2079197 RepID=UPI002846698D|nr:hypothetical protein [Telmatospirillum sp.]MDR3435135.1 hypothetical protein [Telmatospirillum sp.]